jgi:uncharacterized protein (TIGR03086 family)
MAAEPGVIGLGLGGEGRAPRTEEAPVRPTQQLDPTLAALRDLVAGTRPGQLTDPTPCAKWTVRDLLNHFVGGAAMFAAAFRGEAMGDPDGPVPDLLGDDPLAAFDAALATFTEAADAPGAMDRDITLPFATVPAPVAMQILSFDLVVHCWDLAVATGQRYDPPADQVEAALATAELLLQPAARDGDTFADAVAVPADAPALDRLVAFTGRQR